MEKFNPFDYNYEFDTETYVSYVQPAASTPRRGIKLNAYKRFKAVRNGEAYYMSGVAEGSLNDAY